jgi:hypothetical protein
MKKTPSKNRQTVRNTMRKEYRFDYSRAKRNRFAEKMSEGVVAVVLEPDVAAVFKSSKAVNALLRSVIAAMPDQHEILSSAPRTRWGAQKSEFCEEPCCRPKVGATCSSALLKKSRGAQNRRSALLINPEGVEDGAGGGLVYDFDRVLAA